MYSWTGSPPALHLLILTLGTISAAISADKGVRVGSSGWVLVQTIPGLQKKTCGGAVTDYTNMSIDSR
ncbi:uncharacterized protein YALI1_F20182g [Yarrowia lipolytica]|uniref:Uncharacterized protein n=1 Tax=Yarrowia lipolytica TaxID=4952 RepID=A0A1D8NNN2_YARLL|nr:hypothetical protein YALI1_F20182g [Yarrowia lipolytica]